MSNLKKKMLVITYKEELWQRKKKAKKTVAKKEFLL
jgi:hypothetical protein